MSGDTEEIVALLIRCARAVDTEDRELLRSRFSDDGAPLVSSSGRTSSSCDSSAEATVSICPDVTVADARFLRTYRHPDESDGPDDNASSVLTGHPDERIKR